MVRDIIKKIVYHLQYKRIRRLVTFKGEHYNIGPHCKILFGDNSNKNDIVVSDYVDLYGCLYSQSHGKINIGQHVRIGLNAKVRSVESITIKDFSILSEGVIITDNNSHPTIPLFEKYRAMSAPNSSLHLWKHSSHKPVIINENVWIGEFARICKGVTIGKNSIIGANTVVTKDIPENCIAAGNPARVVKKDIDKLSLPITCPEFDELVRIYGTDI